MSESFQSILDEASREMPDGLYLRLCEASLAMYNGGRIRKVRYVVSGVLQTGHNDAVSTMKFKTKKLLIKPDDFKTITDEIAIRGSCTLHKGGLVYNLIEEGDEDRLVYCSVINRSCFCDECVENDDQASSGILTVRKQYTILEIE